MFDELSSAVMAFEPLFTVVNATILDRLRRCTNGAGRHDQKKSARSSTSPSLHLEHYPSIFNTVDSESEGKSGDINIRTGLLSVTNGAQLQTNTNG